MSKITEKTFFQYLKCPTWVYFESHASHRPAHDPLLERLLEDGLIDDVQKDLLKDREDLAEVASNDPEEAFRQTLEFMRDGRQTIFHGTLLDKHWVGTPDVLEKVEGKSNLGDYYYVASDFKRTRAFRDDFKFQACFYAELLQKIQGVKPVQGYIITPDNVAEAFVIDDFAGEYKLSLDAIERIVAGDKPAHFVTSGCKNSPWFEECHGLSASCNDLSLLNRVWREEVRRLKEAGYETIQSLAGISLAKVQAKVPDVDPVRLERILEQAEAIRQGTHKIIGRPLMPEASVELFFDVESDPLRDFDYLFGVLSVSDGNEQYHLFAAETKQNGKEMWEKFVAFIEAHPASPIYHYGSFEIDVIRRFIQKYGISDSAREALQNNMIDLILLIRDSVIFPLTFYSLKDIAAYIGYSWRADDASGANSVLWFEEWLKTKDKKILQKIIEYNEDDVRATYRLQRWLRENASL